MPAASLQRFKEKSCGRCRKLLSTQMNGIDLEYKHSLALA